MNRRLAAPPHILPLVATALLSLAIPFVASAQPTPAALSAFNAYASRVESCLATQHHSPDHFLATTLNAANIETRVHASDLIIEQLTPTAAAPSGAMLHHWRGTAFVPGTTAAGFEHLLRDFNSYPRHFAPEVLRASATRRDGDHVDASMRVRQHHVLTVVLDTAYDVTFAHLDPRHGYSISRSTRIAEIASPGTASEHPLTPAEDHGFLWRLNTYWTWEQRDGGLYLQVESISLTRSIPRGLGWAVGPYVQSIPRESLEFTLRSARTALSRQPHN